MSACFLLIVKTGQGAVVFLCDTRRRENIIFQFPLRVCHVYHKERKKKHSLVALCNCNRFFASLPKVARSDGIISMS